jgi:hypothetical protein
MGKLLQLNRRQNSCLFGILLIFVLLLSFQLREHLTALFNIKILQALYKTFAVHRLGYCGLILFQQQGSFNVLSFWNRHLTCIAVERICTNCRQIAKRIHSENVM